MGESCVKCEVRITGAKNVAMKRQGGLFVRCYICVGKNKRIQLNTREIITPNKQDYVCWDETFALECNGTYDSISSLKEEKIVFELRRRSTSARTNFIGQMITSSSQLLARAEIPWKSVFESKDMEMVKRSVCMTRKGSESSFDECCVKPPSLEVGIKVEAPSSSTGVSKEESRRRRRSERLRNWDECGCGCGKKNGGFGCSSCVDNELFLVASVLDVC